MIIALLSALVLLLGYLNYQFFIIFTLPNFEKNKKMIEEYTAILEGRKEKV